MGRKDKRYSKTLHQQAYERLTAMQAFGDSKKADKEHDEDHDTDITAQKIYSYSSYQTYWKHTKYFLKWIQTEHPEVTTLKKAKKFVPEWLQSRVNEGLSAWTIQTEAAALNKLFGIKKDDPDRFQPPKRRREDIKRSRVGTERDRHFSVTNNAELIAFCRGTGLRRSEMEALKGKDLVAKEQIKEEIARLEEKENRTPTEEKRLFALKDTRFFPDFEYFIHVRNGKGGRERLSPIIGPDTAQIVERIKETAKEEKVWKHVNSNADIHSYRGDYATAIYKRYARDIETIPFDKYHKGIKQWYQGDVYVCKGDERGKRLDRKAMLISSKALGHNRIDVIADHYIRNL